MDPETVNQVCISANAQIVGAVGTFVMLMSGLVNVVPSPADIKNPVGKFISRLLHFAAADIVTAMKKK